MTTALERERARKRQAREVRDRFIVGAMLTCGSAWLSVYLLCWGGMQHIVSANPAWWIK